MEDSSSGDIVFIEPDVTIDMGFDEDSLSIIVPSGVTLASDRGCSESRGALLVGGEKEGADWVGGKSIAMEDDSKMTGLRVEGPAPDREMNWMGEDFDYTDGIEIRGSDVIIENNLDREANLVFENSGDGVNEDGTNFEWQEGAVTTRYADYFQDVGQDSERYDVSGFNDDFEVTEASDLTDLSLSEGEDVVVTEDIGSPDDQG